MDTIVDYPHEYKTLRSYFANEPQVKGYIEGYAAALQDLQWKMTGDNFCGKSYDPMWVNEGIMHSYAYDMKDGGRHHRLSDYKDVGEICEWLLREVVEEIKENH